MTTADSASQPISTSLPRRSRWWLRLVMMIGLAVLLAGGYHFRRQMYVWFALDAGGAALDLNMIPKALDARESLLDEELAACRAKSDIEAVQFLKKLLTGSNSRLHAELDQLYALRRLQELPKEQQAMAVPELTELLEKSFGSVSLTASDMLRSLRPLAEGEAGRLLRLASSGDPVWRRTNALSILASFKSESPEVIGALTRAAGEDPNEHFVRAHGQRLLQSQSPAVKAVTGSDLMASEFVDARVAALSLLESAAAASLVVDTVKATRDPAGQVRAAALFALRRVAPAQAIEAANMLRHDPDDVVRAAALGTLLKSTQPPDQVEVDTLLSSLHRSFLYSALGPEIRLRCLHAAGDVAPEQAIAWAKEALEATKKDATFTDYHRKLLQDFITTQEKEY